MRYTLLLLFTLLIFSSCEDLFSTTVEADPPKYDPQMVFHLLMSDQDSTVQVTLTRSFGLLEVVRDEKQWEVAGARVEWWQNGQQVMTLLPQANANLYKAQLPQKLKPGEQYEVRVTHPDYPAVRTVQTMPNYLQVDSAKVRNLSSDPNNYGQQQVDLVIRDKAGEQNYYEISIFVQTPNIDVRYNPITMKYEYDTIGYSQYAAYFEEFLDQNVVYGTGNTALISDQLFDGQPYKFQAKYNPSYWSSNAPPTIVRVRNVTKEYYQWSRSYYQRYENEFEIFAEPTPVLNNLDNGLGIFGLSTERSYLVK